MITTRALLILMLSLGIAGAQESRTDRAQADSAAATSLQTYAKLVSTENARSLGFESPAQVSSAKLGEPLRIYFVRLDQLREYAPGHDPNTLLSGSDKLLYPVTTDGTVRSSVIVEKYKNVWRGTSVGNPPLARSATRARDAARRASVDDTFLVHVAALNMYFLGARVSGQLKLGALIEDKRVRLAIDELVPAEHVLEQLVPIARAYNGLPM
jgi:hypothetical protein